MNKSYRLISAILIIILIKACNLKPTYDENLHIRVNTHQYKTPVLIGKENNAILKISVYISDTAGPLVVKKIFINTEGTTDLADVEAIRLFYSGDSDDFSTKQQFGKTATPDEKVTFKSKRDLTPGVNNFWVSYQLSPNADLLHKVDALCDRIVIDNMDITPILKSPPIKKRIGHALRYSGDDGVDTYRIPGLVTTNKSTLIGVYDIRRNSSVDLQEDIDIGMSRSSDGGQTWEPMKVIIDMGEWGGKPHIENGIGDPSILVDRQTNTIWVAAIWAHGHPGERNWFASKPGLEPEETSQFVLVKSEDDGVSWSEPINITSQIKNPKWHLLLQGPGKGITLRNGTLVFPAQFKDENEVPHSTLIFSRDHGKTWGIGSGVRAETTEAQIVQLDNGDIMINARNNEAHNKKEVGRVVATTNDLGSSWQEHPSSITGLEESACMASLANETFQQYGQLLLFSNPNTHTGRFNMTIKVSEDEGQTWPDSNWLLLDQGRGRGYSCMTKIDEETIGILYEGSQADMVFEKVKISEIVNQL